MQMAPGIRKAALALHVCSSVGWIGAAVAYLALALAAQLSQQTSTIYGAWISMDLIGWAVTVPLGCLAYLTGLLMSLGTSWGLVRHYWVLIAFVLTTFALGILLLHMPTVTQTADLARTMTSSEVLTLGGDILHPALGIGVLVVVAVLNIYKPRGQTGLAQQKRPSAKPRATDLSEPS
jgi:hypothetical protein